MPRHTQREAVKSRLEAKGWTQTAAAKELGVRVEHVNRVLNGARESRRVLRDLEALPDKSKEAAHV